MEEIMQIKTVTGRHSGSEVRWCFDRRSALGLGLLVALSACSGSWERAVTDVSSDHSATPSEARSPKATASPTAPERRPASELSVTPDLPSRVIKQTAPSGKSLSMYGMTLTVPEMVVSGEQVNDQGLPVTTVQLGGTQDLLPNFVVTYLKEAGKTLDDETHLQEAFLLGPGREDTYVMRTPETWMLGTKEVPACLVTWIHRGKGSDGGTVERDNAALWITNDAGGYWRIIAHAPIGELTKTSPTWRRCSAPRWSRRDAGRRGESPLRATPQSVTESGRDSRGDCAVRIVPRGHATASIHVNQPPSDR